MNTNKPNIVVILADDMGYKDVGYQGSEIQTPNLDRLAGEGVRLNQFYVMAACTPTRASMLTGRYPMRYGFQVGVIKPKDTYGLPTTERLLSQALKEAGYSTAITGKWHLGQHSEDQLPTQKGFDHQYGCYNGMIDYWTHMFNHRIKGISATGVTCVDDLEQEWEEPGNDWSRNDQPLNDEGYATDLITKEAVDVISNHNKANPLFLYVPYTAPHSPLQVPQKYLDMYRQEDMAIAKGPLDTLIYSVRGLPEEELQYRRRIYAGMVTCMDDGIGEVMESLDKRGMAGNTLLFFCSDNGGAPDLGALNDPLRGSKTSLYDGGVKVPAFFHWPDHLPSGSDIEHPLHIVDLFPTLVNQAGGISEKGQPLDGKDIWDTLTSGKKPPREEILLNAAPYTGAIRAGDWKLVRNGHIFDCVSTEGEEDRYELFNLRADPGEEHDLSSKHPDILKDLKERLHAYEKQAQQPFQKTTTWPPPKSLPDFRLPAPKNWGHANAR